MFAHTKPIVDSRPAFGKKHLGTGTAYPWIDRRSLSAFRVFGLRVASKQIPQPNRIPIIRLPHRRPAPPSPNHWPRGRHVGRVFEHRSIRPGTRPGLVV